jgi:uncharacterized protein with ParB-like and HNH nuclease domain
MANWEAYRIGDIISDIDDKKFVLPVIQRRLVWDEDKMELLFDTLLKGDSFGGIMVIKEEKNSKPLFSFRPFTKDGEPINSLEVARIEQSQSFVIDGQQRLQSFYIGLSGTINGKILYFDLFSNYNAEFEFKFEGDYKKLPKFAKDDTNKTIKEYKWYPLTELFKSLKLTNNDKTTAKSIIASDSITDDNEKDHILENVAAFYRNVIGGKSLGISEVAIDKTFNETQNRQRIVELFRRLNDGGTKLSPFDLVASILKGFEWQMEGFLEETLVEYSDIGLTQDNLIKLIFLLQDNHKKEMTDIGAADAQFAIDQSERIKSVLTGLKKFLIYSDLQFYYKDGNRSFIPLFFIAYHIFHKNISNQQIEAFFDNHDANNPEFIKIKKWVYYSLLNGVFKSKGAGWIPYKTGIRKILEVIVNYKNTDFPVTELFDVYYDHGVIFTESFDTSNLDALDSQFLYYLIYDRKQTIRAQDIDHIMPKSILEGLGYDWGKINSIKNFQLLDYGTNRGEKNAKPFKQWIDSLPDKKAFTMRHLIPANETLWTEDKFEDFITERARLILNKVDQYVVGHNAEAAQHANTVTA